MTYINYVLKKIAILDDLLTLGRLLKKTHTQKPTKAQGSGYGFMVIKLPPVTGALSFEGPLWNQLCHTEERTQALGLNRPAFKPSFTASNSANHLIFSCL